ncbi:Nucleoid occlusion protein [Roseovarius albus]|uniref:Nucleoid occlusion protein n=1 Tax=Roseovarius albus TaxID=1247867 RepID=A0A1X7A3L4_9RHOB|nr:ParB N-terminal domain-containing protein [Roseovarius albus]SLN69580.1 Nucleoid occlusion protein [Roseovarius albus]
MAKRRKLTAPSAEDLTKIEDEFRRETSGRGMLGVGGTVPPIAQVAAETAAMTETVPSEQRAENARNAAQAQELEQAQADGRLMTDLPLSEIDADAMIRDRIDLDEAELMELRLSIAANGLRLPVEVFELKEPTAKGARYALVSGYRRYRAVQALLELTADAKYKSIRAIIKPRADADAAFVAMVEENEVRSELSHFERGRIAVISAQQGAFVNVEDAVNKMFATASKAKRSKVRSFALIFEELGDMLSYPEQLTEKRGLRLAQALRGGSERLLREALANHTPGNGEEEWAMIEPVLEGAEVTPRDTSRGGRPKASGAPKVGWQGAETLHTSSGVTIRKVQDSKGYVLRFEGTGLDADLMESLMVEIQALLEKP